jgi:hypothetical protein
VPSRIGDGALPVADFPLKEHFGEGTEMCTRGACAPQSCQAKSNSAGSFDFARDDALQKLVKVKHERVSLHSWGRAHGF